MWSAKEGLMANIFGPFQGFADVIGCKQYFIDRFVSFERTRVNNVWVPQGKA
jgi:hypothetical protein